MSIRLLLLFSLCCFTAFAQDAFPILQQTDKVGNLAISDTQTVAQRRHVLINSELFQLAKASGARREFWPETISFQLFPDVYLEAIVDEVYPLKSGKMAVTGKLPGSHFGSLYMIVHPQFIAADLNTGDTRYEIREAGNGTHVVHELDLSRFPQELEPTAVDLPPRSSAERPAEDSGDIIDIMVVYTATARAQMGGTAQIEALIDLAVAETNGSYENSRVNPRVRLVHSMEVEYAESGNIQIDRNRLQNPSDGILDEVHQVREEYGADLVPMLVADGGGYCGIAYIMSSVSTDFRDFGFCIVATNCATGYYSFGHEMGHIQSARHDYFVDGTTNSPFTFNHGFTSPANGWRTVMAYNNACSSQGSNCTRLDYWSNPEVEYGSDGPMGVPLDQSQPAYNAMTLNETAVTIANFMSSADCAGDDLEPNNLYQLASPLVPSMSGTNLDQRNICSGDEDWFQIPVYAGHRLDISVVFNHDNGDLDLVVYDQDLNQVAASHGNTHTESVTLFPPSDATYYFKVNSDAGHQNDYSLFLTTSPGNLQIFSYWGDETRAFCNNQTADIRGLLCYMDNGYTCTPTPCL